mgnify:CR=1 FL=1
MALFCFIGGEAVEKVRLNKKRCQSGMDGMELVLKLENMENLYLPKEELKNTAGNTIVSMECVGGVVKAYVNAVHGVRSNNVQPYGCWGILNEVRLGIVEFRVTEFMREYLQKHLKDQYSDEMIQAMAVKSLEVNVTIPCVGGATPSDVIALIDLALDKTTVFRKRKTQEKYEKVNTGCLFSKSKEYRVKVYDKTEEQRQKGNLLVEENLLRVEIVFIDRALRRMFGDKRNVLDMLSFQSIETMCREYKRVLEKDIINGGIKPCLNYCVEQLVESLKAETRNEISATVTRYKELIPDMEVLRVALKRWYRIRGEEDKSKQAINYYRQKGIGLPEGVLQTIRAFHDAAG